MIWHLTHLPITKVAMNGITHHRSQFFECIALGCDHMPQGYGDESAIHFILTNFENDLYRG
jgi:hypothetical protein